MAGLVALGEFVLLGLPGWDLALAHEFDRAAAFERCQQLLLAFKAAGGDTLVDNSGIAGGRDAAFLRDLAAASGVDLIPSTGFLEHLFVPGYFHPPVRQFPVATPQDVAALAAIFVDELTLGIATGLADRSPVKAGLIRVGFGQWPMTRLEDVCCRAGAHASTATGAAVYCSGPSADAAVLETLLNEGARPERVIVGQRDDARALDPARDLEIASRGAYVAYDHVGWEDATLHPGAISDDVRVDLVLRLVRAGHLERVLLSGGAVGLRVDGEPVSGHGFERLLTHFVPRLRAAGLAEAQLQTILRDNPRRVLATEA